MTGFVYAISDNNGAVKIGYAADPIRRVSELTVGRSDRLTLLGMARGSKADERAAHRLLRAWRIRGEWFRHIGLVAKMVAMMPPPPAPSVCFRNANAPLRATKAAQKESVETVIEALGGQAAITQALGYPHASTVSQWQQRGRIPARRVMDLKRLADERGVRISVEGIMALTAPANEEAAHA